MERVGSSVGRADAETPATDAKLLKLALMGPGPANQDWELAQNSRRLQVGKGTWPR